MSAFAVCGHQFQRLGFKPDVALYISENLTPFNKRLPWQCRELKRAKLIHSSWSSKGCYENQAQYE